MRAITYYEYGGPENLKLEDIEAPEPGPGEVRLAVRAAGTNPYDSHFIKGEPLFMRLFIGLRRPRSNRLGRDVAGVVDAVGPGVTDFKVGDQVYGAAHGAYADLAVGKVSELAPKPERLSWAEAGAVPMAAITALQGLTAGGFAKGMRVLVNGASGGIGHMAVQMAKAEGCHVTASCKTSNVAWVRDLGADEVIDYSKASIFDTANTYDLVLDPISNGSVTEFLGIIKPGGTYVWLGTADMGRVMGPLGRMGRIGLGPKKGRKAVGVDAKRTREDMDQISGWIESGALRVVIEQTFNLEDTPKAIAHVREGHTKGKTVVVVD